MAKATAKPTVYYGTGRRKTAAARVFLTAGKGTVTVNELPLDSYLNTPTARMTALQAFQVTNTMGKFDARVTVTGSGKAAQSDAIRHGISRALLAYDTEAFRSLLKKAGLVTRDDRMVERKKYGLHKARKRPQYSKR